MKGKLQITSIILSAKIVFQSSGLIWAMLNIIRNAIAKAQLRSFE